MLFYLCCVVLFYDLMNMLDTVLLAT